MEFLKKHYEKIVLSAVLLVVAVASFWLTLKVSEVRQTLADQLNQRVGGKKMPLKPVDLTNDVAALKQLANPPKLVLDAERNTFNPIRWVRGAGAGNAPVPDPKRDPATALKLLNTRPLNFSIVYLGPTGIGDPFRYQFSITREHEKQPTKRRPLTTSLTEGTKNEFFLLREVRGPKDSAGEVVIELVGGERITLVKDKPFDKVMGHQADLRFDNKEFPAKRADESITLAGVTYKIVAIGKDELVISAPNGTRTTVRLSTSP